MGTVTLNGEPLEGATITFTSTEAFGHSAFALTGADGSYTLETFAANKPGAMLGDYHVYVMKTIIVDARGEELVDESQPLGSSGTPGIKSLIPIQYSGLNGRPPRFSATVSKGKNVFDFNLEN
jgi:hypothetical protein